MVTFFLMMYPICQANHDPLRDFESLANPVVNTIILSYQRFHGLFELYVGNEKKECNSYEYKNHLYIIYITILIQYYFYHK